MSDIQSWLLDTHVADAHDTLLQQLLSTSAACWLLRPGQAPKQVSSPAELRQHSKHWPRWSSRPWLLGGHFAPGSSPPHYEGPWIGPGQGSADLEEDTLFEGLLQRFDWGLLSFFSSYQSDLLLLISRQAEARRRWASLQPPVLLAQGASLAERHYVSYYDPGCEGLKAFGLALAAGEAEPFLLISTETDDQSDPAAWDVLTHFATVPLKLPAGLQLRHCHDARRALPLWQAGLAVALFSADSDLTRLHSALAASAWPDLLRLPPDLGSWRYGQIYGGGPDERHALFYSREPARSAALWQWLSQQSQAIAISRF